MLDQREQRVFLLLLPRFKAIRLVEIVQDNLDQADVEPEDEVEDLVSLVVLKYHEVAREYQPVRSIIPPM